MQGKGAGPVNRVELESQVLCAALRQSCHLKDRIGAFTSVRELSHLFPDLLPPPEKDDDASQSNKANFYSVIGVRPQTSANGVIAAYLRAVRQFLRTQSVKDSRVEFNRILNAGFILRKPRLRLSHDLVVARRWLHEESRLAQIARQEVTLDRDEALRIVKEQSLRPEAGAAAASAARNSQAPANIPPPAVPGAALKTGAPPVVPSPPAVPVPPPVPAPPLPAVPPVPPLPNVEQPAAARTGVSDKPKRVEVPPVPPLPVITPVEQPVVPPVPATVNKYWEQNAPAPATAGRGQGTPDSSFAALQGDIEIAPGVFAPAAQRSDATAPNAVPGAMPGVPPAVPAVSSQPIPHGHTQLQYQGYNPPTDDGGFPPASVRAQAAAQNQAQQPQQVPVERPAGRISRDAAFVFDESALHRPQQQTQKPMPMLIQLLEAAQFITAVEVQALRVQMEFAPNIPVEKLILNAGYITPEEMASVKLGESLLQAGKISMAQFQVAIYDERTSGLRMAESLQVRGWLSVEVRNAIDEFHRRRS